MANTLPKPKSGGAPKRIVASGPAGGPGTPGAKAQARKLKKEEEKRARALRDAAINNKSTRGR